MISLTQSLGNKTQCEEEHAMPTRRVFARDIKLATVKLVVNDKMGVREVAKQLGSIYRWVQE